ncbi:hypothetical protein CLOLEP_01172 [[Clostridium] leptum DSM 753]|uniref:Uncharacterized protein n=1 Tax=[Clostridium] leptum DSM 753 TaxID=428125 RepID=A7VRI8_9FIRM|nr:hypothetical protein CLOLEP_01172 [[Clostridium] leptum DSM 753]
MLKWFLVCGKIKESLSFWKSTAAGFFCPSIFNGCGLPCQSLPQGTRGGGAVAPRRFGAGAEYP